MIHDSPYPRSVFQKKHWRFALTESRIHSVFSRSGASQIDITCSFRFSLPWTTPMP